MKFGRHKYSFDSLSDPFALAITCITGLHLAVLLAVRIPFRFESLLVFVNVRYIHVPFQFSLVTDPDLFLITPAFNKRSTDM